MATNDLGGANRVVARALLVSSVSITAERRKAMSHPLTNCNESPKNSLPVKFEMSPLKFGASLKFKGRPRRIYSIALAAVTALVVAGVAFAADYQYHSNPWLLSWIPATCCVTNDCCWEVSERELRALPDDEWEVRSTGQVRKRTAFSPDGKFYRCACDYDNVDKHWVKHQGANTRCIFVPMRSAAASLPKHARAH
jgi:hypothetical protein